MTARPRRPFTGAPTASTRAASASAVAAALALSLSLAGCDLDPSPPDPADLPAPTVSLGDAIPASETNADVPRCAEWVADGYGGYRAIPETCQGEPTVTVPGGQGSIDIEVATLLQIIGGASGFEETHSVGVTEQGLSYVSWEDVATTCTNFCTDDDVHAALVVVGADLTGGAPIYLAFQTGAEEAGAEEFRAAVEAMEVVP